MNPFNKMISEELLLEKTISEKLKDKKVAVNDRVKLDFEFCKK
jgi:hypothetical protein